MCIISQVVERVAGTKIFTCFTEDLTRQFLVYSNEVHTPMPGNLMILPVANPDSVQFINLSHYPSFFEDCQKNFIYTENDLNDRFSLRATASFDMPLQSPLPVYSVGSYLASIVPSIGEFHRLDKRQFVVSAELIDLLATKYESEFGFILCKLKQGNHSYHPFAYLHEKHSSGLLFIPTFHYHPHESHIHHEKGDWDHIIYSVGTDFDTTYLDNYRYRFSEAFRIHKLPPEIRWIRRHKMSRWTKHGRSKNMDYWIAGNLHRVDAPIQRILHPRDNSYEFPFTPHGLKQIRREFGGEI